MELTLKQLKWSDAVSYLIVITRGAIDANAFESIFSNIANMAESLADCRVLMDLEEASFSLPAAEIYALVDDLPASLARPNIKLALVSSAEFDCSARLHILSDLLAKRGFRIAMFADAKSAVTWLSN